MQVFADLLTVRLRRRRRVSCLAFATVCGLGMIGGGAARAAGVDSVAPGPATALLASAATPPAVCGPGAAPETGTQGRVPTADYVNGRVKLGYRCNTEQVAQEGSSGGFRTYRYTDRTGRVCAYYDTTLLVGTSVLVGNNAGVAVLDMTDPSHPVRTDTLVTPAMLSPHESLNLNQARGLLAATQGSPATAPGVVDIYDLGADCRHPVLRSTTPLGIVGHEATFAPDGKTFYVASTALPIVTALDVTNPMLPSILWVDRTDTIHGMNVSDDGSRLYAADIGRSRLTIFDVSQIQHRATNPTVRIVGDVSWPNVSIPQTNLPITVGGHPYLVEIDEYSRGTSTNPAMPVGAGRIIDIGDEAHPQVVSQLRLQVNDPAARATDQSSDPGAADPVQGYAGHYCSVPQRVDPGIVACSFIISGLRVFDIHNPTSPREIAYFNPPSRDITTRANTSAASALFRLDSASTVYACLVGHPVGVTTAAAAPLSPASAPGAAPSAAAASPEQVSTSVGAAPGPPDLFSAFPVSPVYGTTLTHWAMSAPTFDPQRQQVWYSDGLYGFYVVRLTNGVWQPASAGAVQPRSGTPSAPAAASPPATPPAASLPATGRRAPLAIAAALTAMALGGAALRRRLS